MDRHSPGSSPLARGTPRQRCDRVRAHRFIPARAGNTGPPTCPTTPGAVHPRSRGEHTFRPCSTRLFGGSSPLARGTRSAPVPRRSRSAVHPRSRGEHIDATVVRVSLGGSSPLARGTLDEDVARIRMARFIPARAGNTHPPRRRRSRDPVHPRSRGEHAAPLTARDTADGSSPLARGTLRAGHAVAVVVRFIPARAGNT